MYEDISVIICCAGMGTRLGIGTTKALVNVLGEPIIKRQLEVLKNIDDIRIVVGYQAEKLINCVNNNRRDIMFAFNYDYQTTGEAESLSKALVGLNEYCVIIDGDILMNPDDFCAFLDYPGECIGVCELNSDEPIFATLQNDMVVALNEESGTHEYSCVAKVKSYKLQSSKGSIYEMLQKLLPLRSIEVRTRDIDTPDDYDRMIEWYQNGYKE